VAAGRRQTESRTAARRTLDVKRSVKQGQTLANAEKSPSAIAGLLASIEGHGIEPDTGVANGDAERVFALPAEFDSDTFDMGVLQRVQEQLADGLEEQRPDSFAIRVSLRIA
jgi:hypothetical protein